VTLRVGTQEPEGPRGGKNVGGLEVAIRGGPQKEVFDRGEGMRKEYREEPHGRHPRGSSGRRLQRVEARSIPGSSPCGPWFSLPLG
jgi:hypothetical protein